MKVSRNDKQKKLLGFSFNINIGNFEAFLRYLNWSTNRLFLRCDIPIPSKYILIPMTFELNQSIISLQELSLLQKYNIVIAVLLFFGLHSSFNVSGY